MARRRQKQDAPAADDRVRRIRHVLLASEGRPFSRDALAAAVALSRQHGARVTVLSIMRIWGTGLGMPHPGLLPNKREQRDAQELTKSALDYLHSHDVEAAGTAIGTRRAAKVILREATQRQCDVIVMGAARRARVGDFAWSNEPYRVARRADVPVYLVKER